MKTVAASYDKISISDKEPPHIVGNLSKVVYATVSRKGESVFWIPPTFIDNVGVTKVVSNLKSGSPFPPHEYNVFYAARDESNNAVKFSFKLIVRGRSGVQNIGQILSKLISFDYPGRRCNFSRIFETKYLKNCYYLIVQITTC